MTEPRRILVVDDQPEILDLTATVLGGAGYEIAVASSGNEALEQLTTGPFDLMLLDINMFRGRRVDPNSIFLNGARPRRRQMDVWSQRSADHRKRFKKVGALKG